MQQIKKRRKRSGLERNKALTGRIICYFWLAGFLLFMAAPLVQSLRYSFSRVDITQGNVTLTPTGLNHYTHAFTADAQFLPMLFDSLTVIVVDVLLVTFFSLFVAVMLNRKFPGRALLRAIFFLPVIITSGALVYVMQSDVTAQFAGTTGQAGMPMLQTVDFKEMLMTLTNNNPAVAVLTDAIDRVYQIIWKSGVQILLFIAGLQAISPALYESAEVEGSTSWESFWKITLPMISPIIVINLVYTIIDSFTDYNNTLLRYIQDMAFGTTLNQGYSAALAWIFFGIISVLLALSMGLLSRKVFYMND
ncbi:MAG: sugar ABC transporter permease [Oscillospiraceae bacterium]|jgi:ABC-type sugar transport system permease subunit|nr:sugar ABC transporter permease [Oscillospiraceae bacterium]